MTAVKLILFVILVFVLLTVIAYLTRGRSPLFGNLDDYFAAQAPPLEPQFTSTELSPAQALKTLVNAGGEVTVEATPWMVSSAGVAFALKFTTHSVELDFDLANLALLKTDVEELRSLSWDGGQGGHHLSGTLKFPALSQETKSLKLTLTDVAGVKERVFEWSL